MKKVFWILCLCSLFVFTSCFEIMNSITYSKGQYHFSYRFMISKELMAMHESFSIDEIMGNETIMDEMFDITYIETQYEEGVIINYSIDPKIEKEDLKKHIPFKKGNDIYIPILFSDGDPSRDVNKEDLGPTQSLLQSAKFRILIGKDIVPVANTVLLTAGNNSTLDLAVPAYDVGDMICIEIPLIDIIPAMSQYKYLRIIP